jgi:hypothetical protein
MELNRCVTYQPKATGPPANCQPQNLPARPVKLAPREPNALGACRAVRQVPFTELCIRRSTICSRIFMPFRSLSVSPCSAAH